MTGEVLSAVNYVVLVVLIATAIIVWFTASTVACIVFAVALFVGALNITGVLGSLFGKNGKV